MPTPSSDLAKVCLYFIKTPYFLLAIVDNVHDAQSVGGGSTWQSRCAANLRPEIFDQKFLTALENKFAKAFICWLIAQFHFFCHFSGANRVKVTWKFSTFYTYYFKAIINLMMHENSAAGQKKKFANIIYFDDVYFDDGLGSLKNSQKTLPRSSILRAALAA